MTESFIELQEKKFNFKKKRNLIEEVTAMHAFFFNMFLPYLHNLHVHSKVTCEVMNHLTLLAEKMSCMSEAMLSEIDEEMKTLPVFFSTTPVIWPIQTYEDLLGTQNQRLQGEMESDF